MWLWKESMEGFRETRLFVLVGLSEVRMTFHWGVFIPPNFNFSSEKKKDSQMTWQEAHAGTKSSPSVEYDL